MLLHEWRPAPEAGHTYSLVLSAPVGSLVQVRLDGLTDFPLEQAVLTDSETSTPYRFSEGIAEITASKTQTRLALIVGTPEYVARQQAEALPDEVSLTSYPNPARIQVTLEYTLPEQGRVTLVLYDLLGRRVAQLVEGLQKAGRHRVALPTGRFASGVYFGRLRVGDQHRTEKIVIVR